MPRETGTISTEIRAVTGDSEAVPTGKRKSGGVKTLRARFRPGNPDQDPFPAPFPAQAIEWSCVYTHANSAFASGTSCIPYALPFDPPGKPAQENPALTGGHVSYKAPASRNSLWIASASCRYPSPLGWTLSALRLRFAMIPGRAFPS